MTIKDKIQKFRTSRRKYIITLVLGVLVIVLGWYAVSKGESRIKLDYAKSLDQVAAVVNDNKLTLRQVAFYVAYEESQVEEQAKIYSPEDTNDYWNLHIDGIFVREAAGNAAIQMAVHDELFYEMAVADEVALTEEEEGYLENNGYDFWADLVERGADVMLGVTEEDIRATMYKVALAQKYQEIYENLQGVDPGDYDFSESYYEALLEEQDYKIYADVWNRVDFGNVTYSR